MAKKWAKDVKLRKGKLGGPGYTKRPWSERKAILDEGVGVWGYRSMLGSIVFLLNVGVGRGNPVARKALRQDLEYLKSTYGRQPSAVSRQPSVRRRSQVQHQLDLDALLGKKSRRLDLDALIRRAG